MANLNESLYSSPAAKIALRKHQKRIGIAEAVRKNAGKDAMTYEQKLATAVTLENTARQIKVLEGINAGGATQPASIGQYKRFSNRESAIA